MSLIATDTADDLGGGPGATALARHPLLCFSILTLLISWLPVIPFALGVFPSPMLPFGPFLAAIITAAVVGGREGLRSYFRRLIRWRVGIGWYAVALLAPVAGWALVAYLNVLLGASAPELDQLAGWSSIATTTLFFLVYPLTGTWEEPGWRGYALPLLLRRHSALLGSVVLGVLWVLWHLPLFIAGHVPWADGAFLFAITFVFTLIYLHTAGSVLVAFLLHATMNSGAGFFVVLFTGEDRVRMYWIAAVLCAVIAIVAIVVRPEQWRGAPATRDHQATPPDEASPVQPPRGRRS